MFTDQELSAFHGVLSRGSNHIEIECGCTLSKFGDTYGKLRVFIDGKLEVDCQCYPGCPKVNLTPVEFANHAGRNNAIRSWKSQIWVTNNEGNRVNLWKTCLLKYHTETFQRPLRGITMHRDEFIRCSRCNKERRFLLRTREGCQNYHVAQANNNWKCSDMPNNQMTCEDKEERQSRKSSRGCPRFAKCKGCVSCVCFGCSMCHFKDCNCQACIDFVQNMHPPTQDSN